MGWTTTHKPSHISAKDYIEQNLLTWTSPTHDYRVLDGGVKNFRTYYGAVECVTKATGERRVFAMIVLLQYYKNDYHNFGYKDMDETCGPYHADCPERILKLLTETPSQHANDWRAACWAKINAKKTRPIITVGASIKYSGVDYQVTAVLGRRGYQVVNPQGRVYRLKTSQAAVATVI